MSETLCQELGLEVPPQVPRGLPSAAQAALVFPSRMKVDVMTWVHFVPKSGLKSLVRRAPAQGPGASRPPASSSGAVGSSVAPSEAIRWFRGRPVRDLH